MKLSALGAVLCGVLVSSAAAQNADRALLRSTPLILKDGRIANVSVHVFPFRGGASELAGGAARELAVLTYDVATDCFLTAQVIGHVGPSEVTRNDTLSAHRLARARADAVQAALIDGGLPAKAIASVWDWQFMVREPRATLWLFRLVEGEDCEGTPLESRASLPVARSEPTTDRGEAARRQATASSSTGQTRTELAGRASQTTLPDDSPAAPSDAKEQDPNPVATAAAAEPDEPAPTESASRASQAAEPVPASQATRPKPASEAAEPVATAQPTEPVPAAPAESVQAGQAVQPVPASSRGDAASGDEGPSVATSADAEAGNDAARQPRQQAAAARSEPASARSAAEPALVIQFANNSSYFSPGTRAELEALVDSLRDGRRYDVRLRVTVSRSTKVVGAKTAAEAAKYNRWLAKRRIERVRSWLDGHAGNVDLAIETEFVDGEARQVEIGVAPAA